MLIMVSHMIDDLIVLGMTTIELDNLMAETAAYLNIVHPDFGKLGARIAVTKLHKETHDSFFEVVKTLYHYVDSTGNFFY